MSVARLASPLCWIEAHSGNPGGECTSVRKILEVECLKAKRTIDETRGNKWPFCKILNEYFNRCTSGDNPGNPPGPTQFEVRGSTLPGRQMWLLQTMCLNAGVDTMLIDNTLSYWENKANIERQAHVKLRLRVRENHEEERRDIMGLLSERRRQDKEAYEEYVRSFGKNH